MHKNVGKALENRCWTYWTNMLPTCQIMHKLAYVRLLKQLEHRLIFQKINNIWRFWWKKIDGISENVSSLVNNGKYGAVKTADPTTPVYYVVKFISEPYMLQGNKTVNKQIINSCEIIVNAVYLIMMKSKTNWYRE